MAKTGSVELATGVTLEYVEQGMPSGVPVLLLHGVSDSWHSFEPVLPHLPESLRVLAPTLRGHGDSSRPATGYATRDFAGDIRAFMDALVPEPAVIVGHSMGSFVARRLAIDYPDRALGLVLVGSFLNEGNPGVLEMQRSVAQLTDPVDPDFVREFQESTLAQPVAAAFFETVLSESLKVPVHVWKAAIAGVAEDDSSRDFDRIQTPTLIVCGDRDEMCPPSDRETLEAAIAGSRLVVYPGTGHGVHWEEPERFASDLVNFIESALA